MATIGLSFGSPSGGTGFDVASTVTSILAISSAIETPWKTQIASLAAQGSALSGLGSNLSSLSAAVTSLTDFNGVFAAKQGSSSDTNTLSLTSASSSAVAGSHTILVSSLARTATSYSDLVPNASDLLTGSLTIGTGSDAHTLVIDSSNNTLPSLAAAINAGSYGVTASLVGSSTGSRLSLVSKTSGAAGQVALTSDLRDQTGASAIRFTTGQSGQDAQITIDGLPVQSASNTVSNVIGGVTFQLLAPSTSPLQVEITNDNTSIESAVQNFVKAYNTTVSSIKTQEGKDSTGAAEPLYGSPTLSLLQNQLASSLLGGVQSGAVKSIAQLGLSLNPDGTVSLDVPTLDAKLNTNFSDVVGFFQNAGSFGQNLANGLNNLGSDSPTGAIALAEKEKTAQQAALNADVTREDTLLAAQKTQLTTELNQANQILQSIPSQLNQVNEIYSAVTGYNTGSH